jgi:hypothetical protein
MILVQIKRIRHDKAGRADVSDYSFNLSKGLYIPRVLRVLATVDRQHMDHVALGHTVLDEAATVDGLIIQVGD